MLKIQMEFFTKKIRLEFPYGNFYCIFNDKFLDIFLTPHPSCGSLLVEALPLINCIAFLNNNSKGFTRDWIWKFELLERDLN